MKTATFSKNHRTLEFFSTHNTMDCVNCETLAQAKIIVARSGVQQKIRQA